jgi:hypothetical protein
MFVFLFVCFFSFYLFCVLVLFSVLFPHMCIAVYFLFVYSVTDHCNQLGTQLQLIHISVVE